MAKIIPFKGILYNKEKIRDIKDVVAPPYDVISPAEQEELYKRHENNVVRLILGKESNSDTPDNNRYTKARDSFDSWQRDSILIKDAFPSIYVYSQEYHLGETEGFEKKRRLGLIALSKLEDFGEGKIHPHENTLAKPKEDRLKLMQHCNANFSSIFGLFSDPSKRIDSVLKDYMRHSPLYDLVDDAGMRHTLWAIRDNRAIQIITSVMSDKQIFIADGHHRYETAINYRNEMRGKLPDFSGEELYNYVMMYFTNTNSEGLSILPIHRLVSNLSDFDKKKIVEKAGEFFNIEKLSFNESDEKTVKQKLFSDIKERGEKEHIFGMYLGNDEYLLLTLKDEDVLDRLITNSRHPSWKKLDVTILHTLLIEKVLRISEKNLAEQKNITYTISGDEAIKDVKAGKYQIALFLNPTKIEDVKDVAAAGEKMPQKSTFFYPKLITGLVMNKLE
ncbi:MAG: hypothetical protein A2889_00520 [Nitrospinae bacterium RIFCSPLOWO2_01_FULL_39_10]|nr:MAG: hypothetical protein A2889_00520 [Nitrospinae bacterium RIFCSPLOWO2_01_FULL_39_10]